MPVCISLARFGSVRIDSFFLALPLSVVLSARVPTVCCGLLLLVYGATLTPHTHGGTLTIICMSIIPLILFRLVDHHHCVSIHLVLHDHGVNPPPCITSRCLIVCFLAHPCGSLGTPVQVKKRRCLLPCANSSSDRPVPLC